MSPPSSQDPNYPPEADVPLDEKGFAVAFSVDDVGQAAAFFDEWGYVVFCDILSGDECDRTVDEIWDQLESTHDGLDRHDLRSYDCLKLVHGLAPVTPQWSPQVVRNRGNARLLKASPNMRKVRSF